MICTLRGRHCSRHRDMGLAKRRPTNSYQDKKRHDVCVCRCINIRRRVNIVNSKLKEGQTICSSTCWELQSAPACLATPCLPLFTYSAYLQPCHSFFKFIWLNSKLLHKCFSYFRSLALWLTSVSVYHCANLWFLDLWCCIKSELNRLAGLL